jgi:hypothetical protein
MAKFGPEKFSRVLKPHRHKQILFQFRHFLGEICTTTRRKLEIAESFSLSSTSNPAVGLQISLVHIAEKYRGETERTEKMGK